MMLGETVVYYTIDDESPVAKSITSLRSESSSMGHVESRVNQQGPPFKAKYSWVIDSEVVQRGKGEKEPLLGREIEHETVNSQAVGGAQDLIL